MVVGAAGVAFGVSDTNGSVVLEPAEHVLTLTHMAASKMPSRTSNTSVCIVRKCVYVVLGTL